MNTKQNINISDEGTINIVYAATGERYFQEALTSAESVRKLHEGCRIVLYTNVRSKHPDWIEVRQLENAKNGMGDKIYAISDVEFDRFIYLDSDTYIIDSLKFAWELLEKFDFLACIGEIRVTPRMQSYNFADFEYSDVPTAFPEFNSGVMFFRRSQRMTTMLAAWLQHFEEETSRYNCKLPDQPSLRHALFNSDLRLHALPSEYNMRLPYFGYYERSIVVLHGRRTRKGFEKLKSKWREARGPRVYIPRIGTLHQNAWPFLVGLWFREKIIRFIRS